MHPVSGDFNGDGLSDAAVFDEVTGVWSVSVSDGSTFMTTDWVTFGTTGWTGAVVADFGGDGKADIATFHAGLGWS